MYSISYLLVLSMTQEISYCTMKVKVFTVFVVIHLYLRTNCVMSNQNASLYKCGATKSFKERECFCAYKKHKTSVFPILYADCTRMGIQQLPNLKDVEHLDVSNNLIEILDSSKSRLESPRICSLRISYNRLHSIYQDFFKDMPNLIVLDLSNNELVKFTNSLTFEGITKLEVLNLSFNRIPTLPENIFGNLFNLRELDLSYNYLGSLFSTDHLFNSSLGLSSNITILKLDGLGITNISSNFFNGAYNLEYLSLVNNPLTNIPSVPNTLIYLDVSGSNITKISREFTCRSLKILKLNRLAKLEMLEDCTFCNLIMLQELQLDGCKKLNKLDSAFNCSKNVRIPIKKLHVTSSGLSTISSNLLDFFNTMEYLDLQNNPWTCDCDILWLRKLNVTQFPTKNLRCVTPNNLLNRKIMELTDKDLINCFDNGNYYQTVLAVILCCLLVVLGALIVYFVYLGPIYRKQHYRNIGPQSPYNGNTISGTPNGNVETL